MQSHNYVPGVSGWKMHSNGTLEVEGKVRAIMVEQAETPELPFAIEGDQVVLSQAFVDGTRFSAGEGLGCMCEGGYTGAPAEKQGVVLSKLEVSIDASKVLDQISSIIGTVELAQSLQGAADMIKEEVSARTAADAMLSARIGSIESALASLSARLAAKQ
ncbi:hypothetical protein [Pseudomonas viridiflava]|uniref:hypothetical protein n=1 Tax=Pseudomonas viridiflava TaxID=33069 RepID=UPI001C312B3E|nr:hypothetical protein [Pseudomonas viridiflava]QXG49221.1 hypothetical protein KTT57_09470 [Pseudomonas viridiflava]